MFESMTSAEKLTLGFETTGLGLLVTFVVLIFLIVVIYVLSVIIRKKRKGDKPDAEAVPPRQASGNVVDDGELLAVLTAAVAYVMTGDASNTTGLVVRSYRKVHGASAWAKAGRDAQIYNKF